MEASHPIYITRFHSPKAGICKSLGVLLALFIFSPSLLSAQKTYTFNLNQCIEYARKNSPSIKIARKSFQNSYWNFKALKASLLPSLSFSADGPGLIRSISAVSQDDGTINFVSQNQARSSAAFSLQQEIWPTGGRLFLSTGLERIDVFGTSGYGLWNSNMMRVGYIQPIYQFNSLKWQRKILPLTYRVAEIQFKEALEDISVAVAGQFFSVYIAQITLQNAQFNEQVNDSIYTISKGRFNVGKIAENDLLASELAVMKARTSVANAEIDLQNSIQRLKIVLNLPDADVINIIPPTDIPIVEVNKIVAVDQAMHNRSEIEDFKLRQMQTERDVAQAKYSNSFSADINATFGLNQSGSALSDAYSSPLDQETATIGINIPILQWGRAKAVRKASLALQERTMEQIQLDTRNLRQDIVDQVNRFKQLVNQVQVSAKTDTIAQRRFLVAKNRYLIGKIDVTNLQIAQNEKDLSRRDYVQTLRNYWMEWYRLRRSTLFDFEIDAPIYLDESAYWGE